MIDERTFETLSRYVDGDLGFDEIAAFEDRLTGDDELGRALDDVRQLREGLRAVALDERPAQALDIMVRPLRRAGRPWRQRWAVASLVAAAAVVVVALIVVEDVGRSGLKSGSSASGGTEPQVFALKNLPAADEDAPIGAIESLLAQDDLSPELAQPEAEIVMGPLDHPPGREGHGLSLAVEEIRIPLPESCGSVGERIRLSISDGRVVSCRTVSLEGETIVGGCVCQVLVALPRVEVSDGDHHAWVVETVGP